jgi:hypothetical protein
MALCNDCFYNPFHLGCYNTCDNVLALSHASLQVGVYTLQALFMRKIINIPFEVVTPGQVLEFDLSKLNANYAFDATILQPDGTQMSITSNGNTYDCLRFTTKIGATGATVWDIQN